MSHLKVTQISGAFDFRLRLWCFGVLGLRLCRAGFRTGLGVRVRVPDEHLQVVEVLERSDWASCIRPKPLNLPESTEPRSTQIPSPNCASSGLGSLLPFPSQADRCHPEDLHRNVAEAKKCWDSAWQEPWDLAASGRGVAGGGIGNQGCKVRLHMF